MNIRNVAFGGVASVVLGIATLVVGVSGEAEAAESDDQILYRYTTECHQSVLAVAKAHDRIVETQNDRVAILSAIETYDFSSPELREIEREIAKYDKRIMSIRSDISPYWGKEKVIRDELWILDIKIHESSTSTPPLYDPGISTSTPMTYQMEMRWERKQLADKLQALIDDSRHIEDALAEASKMRQRWDNQRTPVLAKIREGYYELQRQYRDADRSYETAKADWRLAVTQSIVSCN